MSTYSFSGTNLGTRNTVVSKMDKIVVLMEFILWRKKNRQYKYILYCVSDTYFEEKQKEERRRIGSRVDWLGMYTLLNKAVKEGLSEKVTFEPRLKRGEELPWPV